MDIIDSLFNNWHILLLILIIVLILYRIFHPSNYSTDKPEQEQPSIFRTANKFTGYTHITDVLERCAKRYPKYPALRVKKDKTDWETITYREYWEHVLNFAESINYWLGPEVNVGIMGFNSPGWFYAHLGTMLCHGYSVGLYNTLTPPICQKIINNSNIEILVVEDDEQLQKFVDISIPSVKLIVYYAPIKDDSLITKFNVPVLSMGNFMSKKLAFDRVKDVYRPHGTHIYTSGTTGDQKAVVINQKQIMSSLRNMIAILENSTLQLNKSERYVSYLPLNHIAALIMDIYIPLITLGTVWFADRDALKGSLTKTLKECRPTVFMGVPRIWEKMAEDVLQNIGDTKFIFMKYFIKDRITKELGLDACKYCITSAAPISSSAREFFANIGIKLYDIYVMSETTGPISISAPGIEKNGSVGRPVMKIKIDTKGELSVKGDNLFTGYHKDKRTYEDDWFKTGDLAKLDHDGFLYITGRKKDIIVTAGGENISPLPIENAIQKKLGKIFDHVVVIGDKRKFLSVILVPKMKDDKLNKEFRNIDPKLKRPSDCMKSELLNNYIKEIIDGVNKNTVSRASNIQRWLFVPNKFTVGDEITPTLKLRRNFINTKYEKMIDDLYVRT